MPDVPNEIRIVYAKLETLQATAANAASMLTACSELTRLDFAPNSEVCQAYGEYLGNWKKHRGELQQGLDGMAQVFQMILAAFQEAEQQLIDALNGGIESTTCR